MEVQRHHDFSLSASDLLEALTSQRYFESRFAMSGIDDYHFEAFEETRDGLLIRILRDLEISGSNVPSFARRFLGTQYTLVQEFLWKKRDQPPYRAEYRFALGNVPVEVRGAIEIEERDGVARQHYRVRVSSSMPLIGRKLEKLVGERVEKALDSDYRGTLRFLEQEGLIGDA